MVTKTRESNIELLRIISMIMVVVLHFFYHGEILRWTTVESSGYLTYWSVEALAFVAVNVFVLISGYFLCLSRFRLLNFPIKKDRLILDKIYAES